MLSVRQPSVPTQVAAEMVDLGGDSVGRVSLVAGHGTLVAMDLPGWRALSRRYGQPAGGRYRLDLVLDDGSRASTALPVGDDGSWHVRTAVDRSQIARVAIADDDGRNWCEARFA
jgi:hypothetical protein